MYVPATFQVNDLPRLHDFIEQYSFATLVSVSGGAPFATHMPLLLDRGEPGRLVGHLAKANPQWREADGQEVLTIFAGPHAYISPTWYQDTNVVPTWNYTAVHVYGRLQVEHDPNQLVDLVRRYVDVYESGFDSPWPIDSADSDFIHGLVNGIVGFTVEIERMEGKFKLNQNQSDERRERVIEALDGGSEQQQQIADLMRDS